MDFRSSIYLSYVMLKLLRTLYGLAQLAIQFWRECRMAMDVMNMARNAVDPCLFYQWIDNQLVVILLWVDDFPIFGPDELVPGIKDELLSLFSFKDVGEIKEYVGCRIKSDRENGWIRLTQPVKIQKFVDKYGIDINRTPAMMPLAAPLLGPYYLEGHISLQKRTYCPLLRESATPFKSTCFLIKLN
jgi:hypothetical protein